METDFPLHACACELHFIQQSPGRLPGLSTAVWRGVLGMQMKRMSQGAASCPALPGWLPRERLYEYFMETPPPPDTPVMRRYSSVPHPFVLLGEWSEQERHLQAGQSLQLQLRLFGRACMLVNVVILALARGAAGGLGKARARAQLQHVSTTAGDGMPTMIFEPGGMFSPPPVVAPDVPAMPDHTLHIHFESPLRLQHKGRILGPDTFSATTFLMNIVRRYSMLSLFHEGRELQADFRALKRQAEQVRVIDKRLRMVRLQRYSARQGRTHPLDGVVGDCTLDMREAPDLWPFLWLGQYTLAGKGTVYGLGRYGIAG